MTSTKAVSFDSLDALASSSSEIVHVRVIEQVETFDRFEGSGGDFPVTVSTVEVLASVVPAERVTSAGYEDGPKQGGEQLYVTQFGRVGAVDNGEPILGTGREYLLFVVPAPDSRTGFHDYYVTGGDSGVFEADGGAFRHLGHSPTDSLPEMIEFSQLRELSHEE